MKKTITFFFLFFCTVNFYGQGVEEITEEDEIIDNLLIEESELVNITSDFQFLHFSVDFNDKTYFSGRDIGIEQFSVNPQVTYIDSRGFFAGITGVYYDKFAPEWDYTSAVLGYGKRFGKNKQFRWSASYTRYFYSDTSEDNPFTNEVSFGLELDNAKKTLGTEINTAYLFGSDNSFQIISSTYGVINLFKKNNKQLKLQPQLNIIIAQQTVQLTQTFIFRDREFTRYIQNNDFGLINTQLRIPLQYEVGDFDVEVGYNINLPTELEGETDLKTTSFFNFTLSYLIDL